MKKIIKNKKRMMLSLVVLVFAICFFGFISSVNASSSVCGEAVSKPLKFTFNVPLPGYLATGVNSMEINCMTLGNYIKYIYKFIIGVTGLLAVFMITLGSLKWIFSGGSSAAISQAKQYINGAIAGILIALGSYSVLYIINPQLVEVKPIIIPITKKAMMATCPDTGTKSSSDKRTYVRTDKTDEGATTAYGTWCGLQYKIKDDNNSPLCYGLSCRDKEVCTPFVHNDPLDSQNVGKYEKYSCLNVDKAKSSTISGCNNTTDTTTGNKKAQEETQAACDDINAVIQNFPAGTFNNKEGDKCVWLNYNSVNFSAIDLIPGVITAQTIKAVLSNGDGCRWCPNSYYKKIVEKMDQGKLKCESLEDPSKNPDQDNGKVCTEEEGCSDPIADSDTNGHEYTIDACAAIIYNQKCRK